MQFIVGLIRSAICQKTDRHCGTEVMEKEKRGCISSSLIKGDVFYAQKEKAPVKFARTFSTNITTSSMVSCRSYTFPQ